MYDLSKPGYLLIFKDKDKDYFLYLYAQDINAPFAGLIVLPEIQKVAKELSIELEIKQFSEFKRIPLETNIEEAVINVPIEIFADSSGKFKDSLFRMCLENLLSGYNSIFPIREIGAVARDYSFVHYKENFDIVINDHILKGKNLIINAPRRAGKTSFMWQLVKEKRLKEHKAFYVDMENARNPVQFSAILLMTLKGKKFKSELEKTKEEMNIAKKIGSQYRQKIEEELKKNWSKEKIVLAVDECSFLIEEMLKKESSGTVTDFLRWFKEIRKANPNIRFVFSGSIKFTVFEKDLGENKLFDDCREYSLKPFNKESAANLVEGLFYSEEIYPPDYVIKEIIRLTTPYFPYFLQIVTDEMIKFYRSNKTFPGEKEIPLIIDSEIIGTSCRRYLDQPLIYLRRYDPKEQSGAKAILNHLSGKDKAKQNTLEAIYIKATGDKEGFEKTLALLEYDFYLEKKGNEYRFNNEIIRNWWKINFAEYGESG